MGQLVDGKWSTENVLVQHDDKGLYFTSNAILFSVTASAARPGPSFLPSLAGITFTAPLPARGLIARR